MRYLFFALRPKQWIKNLFIFLPLIFGKKFFSYPINLNAGIAFFLFSLTAGVVYLVNDIMDYEKDKLHPTKRLRPIAAGRISIREAHLTAWLLGIASMAGSFMLNVRFGLIAAGYLVFNVIYTRMLKEIVIIDMFCIGGFFLLRIMAGSVIADVTLSHWIIFMTVLLALFLALNKRRQELVLLEKKAYFHRPALAGYSFYFIDQMIAVITSSIVVAYMLYTVDARTVGEFGTKHLVYSIPFVYYGIFRYLYIIHRLRKEGDPTRILLSDRPMQMNIVLWVAVCMAVIYFGF